MVRIGKNIIYILIISFAVILLNPSLVFSEKNLIHDSANLFTSGEIDLLEVEANSISDEYNMDIVIVTLDDAEGKSSREYADDFFDYGGFGRGNEYDGILFLIDMDNGEAYISTTGMGIRYLTDQRIESVLDIVFDEGLNNGDYYGAAAGFLKGTKGFLEQGIPAGQHNFPEKPVPKKLTFADLVISILGGTTAGGMFYFVNKSRYKTRRQANPYSYRNNSIVNFNSVSDKLVDTFVTHRIIPKSNPSSGSSVGRSTTHKSSSGRSHGGGGRKF